MLNLQTVVIAPDSSVTDANSNVAGGTQAAAVLTVGAEAGRTINILVDGFLPGTGYSLINFQCNYDGAVGDSACSGASYAETAVLSATLLVGATLQGNGAALPGFDNTSFNVTVTYQ
jgi:hypothetical protein